MTRLGDVVSSWLSYQLCVTDVDLLAESSIRFPIVNFLDRINWIDSLTLECNHPLYSLKHIDFCWIYRNKMTYLELKYASTNTKEASEQQRIFNDITRLALLQNTKKNCKLYFMMVGEAQRFQQYFQNLNVEPSRPQEKGEQYAFITYKKESKKEDARVNSKYNEMFSFQLNGKKIINVQDEKFSELYKKYKSKFSDTYEDVEVKLKRKTKIEHKKRKVNNPDDLKFETKLISFPSGSNYIKNCRVGIWEITRKY